jgi:hypothetical protein
MLSKIASTFGGYYMVYSFSNSISPSINIEEPPVLPPTADTPRARTLFCISFQV